MNVLVACEYSGVVRRAFRDRGHNAWSCDILPSADDSPYHIQGDVLNYLNGWDMMIAHPPCTYLCNSGVSHLYEWEYPWLWTEDGYLGDGVWVDPYERHRGVNRKRYREMVYARRFFMRLLNAPIPKIAVENPVPHKYAKLPKYDQTIQPYQFGDDASKRTCLWLSGLPKLTIPTSDLWYPPRIVDGKKRWSNQTDSGQNKLPPSETRSLERAKTYEGIANAFAEQWGIS